VTITDAGGKTFSFLANEGYDAVTDTGEVNFDVTDIGEMVLHVGANMDQTMNVKIPEVSTESLYIDDLDVTTINGASRAISQLDSAIAQVSSVRSRLGAYENRLEYSVDSLDEFGENMTDAISRLTDVDMAEEMSNYTQLNVLNQAAISVLTQANEMPQQILQIMQL
jgi:flagellin